MLDDGGFGRGIYGGVGSASTSLSENEYREGTIVIDLYDTAQKKLI